MEPSIAATLGEQHFGRYIGVAFIEELFLYTNCSFGTWVPGRYTEVAFIQGWALRGVPLYMYVVLILIHLSSIVLDCITWHVCAFPKVHNGYFEVYSFGVFSLL